MLYKILTSENKACHGGTFDYTPYVSANDVPTPMIEDIALCQRGYHVTQKPFLWYKEGARVYLVEGIGKHEFEDDKVVYQQIRFDQEDRSYNRLFRNIDFFLQQIQEGATRTPKVLFQRTRNQRYLYLQYAFVAKERAELVPLFERQTTKLNYLTRFDACVLAQWCQYELFAAYDPSNSLRVLEQIMYIRGLLYIVNYECLMKGYNPVAVSQDFSEVLVV